MEHEIIGLVISILAAFMSSIAAIAIAAWYIGGKINALSARVDGLEKHFGVRFGNLEREVHSINELLRRRPE